MIKSPKEPCNNCCNNSSYFYKETTTKKSLVIDRNISSSSLLVAIFQAWVLQKNKQTNKEKIILANFFYTLHYGAYLNKVIFQSCNDLSKLLQPKSLS